MKQFKIGTHKIRTTTKVLTWIWIMWWNTPTPLLLFCLWVGRYLENRMISYFFLCQEKGMDQYKFIIQKKARERNFGSSNYSLHFRRYLTRNQTKNFIKIYREICSKIILWKFVYEIFRFRTYSYISFLKNLIFWFFVEIFVLQFLVCTFSSFPVTYFCILGMRCNIILSLMNNNVCK